MKLKLYFRKGKETLSYGGNFDSVQIINMNGAYAPNSKDRSDIRLSAGRGLRIINSISRGKDPVISGNKVVN
jgi:hypothetical protein